MINTNEETFGRIINAGFTQKQTVIDRINRRKAKYKARLREKKIDSIFK